MAEYRYFGTLRFALALCVVLQHFGSQIAPASLRDVLNPLALGNCAVFAFFVLSGFIIAEAAEQFYKHRPAAFLLNRFLRLVPPFIVSMTATIGVYLTMDAIDNAAIDDAVFSPWGIAINYLAIFPLAPFPGRAGDASHTFILAVWALRVEFLFYIVFAGCLAASIRRPPGPALVAAGCAAVGLFFASRIGYAPRALEFAPYFVFGVAYFYALRGQRAVKWIGLAALLCMVLQFHDYDAGSPIAGVYDRAAQYGILGAMLLAFMVLAHVRSGRGHRIDQKLGDLSYVVYLNHAAVQAVFLYHVGEPSALSFALALVITILYSMAMLGITEPPLRFVRDQVRGVGLHARRTRRLARSPQA
jgi:peptidoglycan/LPS O-acetylase OafA/YrhL